MSRPLRLIYYPPRRQNNDGGYVPDPDYDLIYLGDIPEDRKPILKRARFPISPVLFNKISSGDRDVKLTLDQIRKACKVWIKPSVKDGSHSLKITSTEEVLIFGATSCITRFLISPTGPDTLDPVFLVQPAENGCLEYEVTLGETPKAANMQFLFNQKRYAKTDEDRAVMLWDVYVDKFDLAMRHIVDRMQRVPGEMRMRVHFGKMHVDSREKGVKQMEYPEFLVYYDQASKRGAVSLDPNVGGEKLAYGALEKVLSAPDRFFAESHMTPKLEDMVPRQFLALYTKQGLRLDIEVERIFPTLGKVELALGQIRAYDVGINKKAEINSISPDRNLHWKLEVLIDTGLTDLPTSTQNIREKIKLGDGEGKDNLPTPIIAPSIIEELGICGIEAKTVWTVICPDTDYMVDITLYRHWESMDTRKTPKKTCGMALYGMDWEEKTRCRNIALYPRDFGTNGEKLFEPGDLEDLLIEIEEIQDFFGDVYAAGQGDEPVPQQVKEPVEEAEELDHTPIEEGKAEEPEGEEGDIDLYD